MIHLCARSCDKLPYVPDVLTARDLTLSQERALPQFSPPPRFGETSFAGYEPQHPSQREASQKTQAFAREVTQVKPTGFRWPWQEKQVAAGRGLYLDGGFGTGKTHLLAAAYHACGAADEAKAYMSFQELVYVIGAKGMAQAKEGLAYKLFCIDEFELDDPGNTLIVKTFLSHAFAQGSFVMTTSNTPPEAQGQGRFNASDFKREIQSIAERFDAVLLEGPDYRQRDYLAELLSEQELERRLEAEDAPGPKVHLGWRDLLTLLSEHHPIRYGDLLRQIGTLYLSGMRTLSAQNDALRFVHFIDKLYDLKIGFRGAGEVALDDLFSPDYRGGAYAKKHYRCLSRLSELLEERF